MRRGPIDEVLSIFSYGVGWRLRDRCMRDRCMRAGLTLSLARLSGDVLTISPSCYVEDKVWTLTENPEIGQCGYLNITALRRLFF